MKVLACILGLVSLGAAVSVAPPPHEEYARMARYIVHQSGKVTWLKLGTITCMLTTFMLYLRLCINGNLQLSRALH